MSSMYNRTVNTTFSKQGTPIFIMSLITILIFGYIALNENILDKSDTLDPTLKGLLLNSSFFISIVVLINSLGRKFQNKSSKLYGDIFVNSLIGILLLYFSSTDFSLFCENNNEEIKGISLKRYLNKEFIQRLAKFSFIYIILWRIMKPIMESVGSNSNSSNGQRVYGMIGTYVYGIILLLFMKFYKTGENSNMTVFNEGEDKHYVTKLIQDGGWVASIMMLFAMIVLSSKNL